MNPSIVVMDPGDAQRLSPKRWEGYPWLYLGKDAGLRDRIARGMGKEKRWPLQGQLHRMANALRKPFLDLVAQIGSRQSDRIGWWSSSLSWKMWVHSDLFLLISYLGLAEEAIQAALRDATNLILVVEDPWLFQQLKENAERHSVRLVFIGGKSLLWEKAKAILFAVARRSRWFIRMLRDFRRQRHAYPPGKIPIPTDPAVALYSFPHRVSLREDNGWEDPYLPGLDRLLDQLGYRVIRFSPPDRSGFEPDLAKRRSYFRPLILYATFGTVLRSALLLWRPRSIENPSVNGRGIRRLLEREWWKEMATPDPCSTRLFYECLRRMLSQGQWRWILYPYENQPWEKMVALCAHEKGIPAAGIQTALLSNYYLSYFLGEGEDRQMPLPDLIFTSGPVIRQMLSEGGVPARRLRVCGSIRYGARLSPSSNGSESSWKAAPLSEIVVVLPIDPWMGRHLLEAVRAAFPSGGAQEGLRFHVRPHPMCPMDLSKVGFPARIVSSDFGNLKEVLQDCGLVLFTGSTVGFEALAMGRVAIRYRSELLLDVDEIYGKEIPVCNEGNLREVLLQQVREAPADRDSLRFIQQIFAPFESERFKESLCLQR